MKFRLGELMVFGLPPWSSTVRPWKVTKTQQEAGSSSNHHFFRGKLLNFMGSMCFFFGEQLIFFWGGWKIPANSQPTGTACVCVCCFFLRPLKVAPSDFENLVTYYSNPSQLIHCWWFRNPGFTRLVVEITLFAEFFYLPGGCLGFLNHQQYGCSLHEFKVHQTLRCVSSPEKKSCLKTKVLFSE